MASFARAKLFTAEGAENAEPFPFRVCGLGGLGGEELLDIDLLSFQRLAGEVCSFTSWGTTMRKLFLSLIVLLVGLASTQAQQSGGGAAASDLLGTWTGTWEGAGSTGGFELTLEKSKDGSTAGRVAVTGEPAYKATIGTLTFEGKKMTATYDFPPDESVEVVLTVTFDGNTAKGPWSARQKAGGEVASGTLTLSRK